MGFLEGRTASSGSRLAEPASSERSPSTGYLREKVKIEPPSTMRPNSDRIAYDHQRRLAVQSHVRFPPLAAFPNVRERAPEPTKRGVTEALRRGRKPRVSCRPVPMLSSCVLALEPDDFRPVVPDPTYDR